MRHARWSTLIPVWILVLLCPLITRADEGQRAVAPLPACPRAAVASSIVKKALTTTRKVTVHQCAPMLAQVSRRFGSGPTPAWVIVAVAEDVSIKEYADPNRYQDHMLVIGVDGRLIASDMPGSYSEMDSSKILTLTVDSLRTVDLDGDGYDEILVESAQGRWDRQTTVEVFRVVDTSLVSASSSIPISFSNGGKAEHPTDCGGRWSTSDHRGQRRIVVVNERGSGPGAANCPSPGTSEYVLRDGKLARWR